MYQLSLYWRNPHEAAYVFTPDVTHLMEFELWESIIILNDKTQSTDSREIFGYYAVPDHNKGDLNYSWVWNDKHGLIARSILRHSNRPT